MCARRSTAEVEMNPKDVLITTLGLGGRGILEMRRTVVSVFTAPNDVSGQHTRDYTRQNTSA